MKRLLVSLPLFAVGLLLMFIDFSIVWRYFAWTNQILATITLWAVTIYLTMRRKNYWFMLIPALFMTTVVSAYFFMAPETLALSERLALPLTFATTAIILFLYARWKWAFDRRYPVGRHLQGNTQ